MHEKFECIKSYFFQLTVILVFICVFFNSLCFAQEGKDDSYWWQFIVQSDLSTEPAVDLVPYDWLKEQAQHLVLMPDPDASNVAPSIVTGASASTARSSDITMREIKKRWRENHPVLVVREQDVFIFRLRNRLRFEDAQQNGAIAPPGNWQRIKIQKNRLSFSEWAGQRLQSLGPQVDPWKHTGKLKLLDTLQIVQQIVDCQKEGKSVRECVKEYGLSFASSKAVSELLYLLGGNALLTSAIVGYLGYADYQAVNALIAFFEEREKGIRNEVQNRHQEEINERTARDLWNGSYSKLKRIFSYFLSDMERDLENQERKLFDSWAKSVHAIKKIEKRVEDLGKELKHFTEMEKSIDLDGKFCSQGLLGKKDMENRLIKMRENIKKMRTMLKRLEPFYEKCPLSQQMKRIRFELRKITEINKGITDEFLKIRDLCMQMEDTKKGLLKEYKQSLTSPRLKERYIAFLKAYNYGLRMVIDFQHIYEKYISSVNRYHGRMRNLTLFISDRIPYIYNEETEQKCRKELAEFQKKVKNRKGKLYRFHEVKDYKKEITYMARDLYLWSDEGIVLKKSIKARLERIKELQNKCQEYNKRFCNIDKDRKEINDLTSLSKKINNNINSCFYSQTVHSSTKTNFCGKRFSDSDKEYFRRKIISLYKKWSAFQCSRGGSGCGIGAHECKKGLLRLTTNINYSRWQYQANKNAMERYIDCIDSIIMQKKWNHTVLSKVLKRNCEASFWSSLCDGWAKH